MNEYNVSHRPLSGKEDALRLRQLLIDSHQQIGREFNWETRRWEGSYWYATDAQLVQPTWGAETEIWETDAGQLIGAVIPDGDGDIALQVHPSYRAVEDDMLDWAEQHLTSKNKDQRELVTWAFDWDDDRQQRLQQRGYEPDETLFWHHRRRSIHDPVPDVTVDTAYTIRNVIDSEEDVVRWVDCTNATFGHQHTPDYHQNFQQLSPSHDYNLHLIAEAPDGTFAAFAGLTVDTINRYATFEPVGTHPDHRKKGLARALMFEGIRRLQALGDVDVVYVASWGTSPAGKFYESVGLAHYATLQGWRKQF